MISFLNPGAGHVLARWRISDNRDISTSRKLKVVELGQIRYGTSDKRSQAKEAREVNVSTEWVSSQYQHICEQVTEDSFENNPTSNTARSWSIHLNVKEKAGCLKRLNGSNAKKIRNRKLT